MQRSKLDWWKRYQRWAVRHGELGLTVDVSRVEFPEAWLADMQPALDRAFDAMEALEAGEIANPSEGRQVGHYWLRAPELAPAPLRAEIAANVDAIEAFAREILGQKDPSGAPQWQHLLVLGIGGSALGPMFVSRALATTHPPLALHLMDNTDADGFARVLGEIGSKDGLERTLCIVISKSGLTPETENGRREVEAAYQRQGLDFARHAVAISMSGSKLDGEATEQNWRARFPLWEWVGGRTSETSSVGLLPAALQGIDIRELLRGARECDKLTRQRDARGNPAALLASMWHYLGHGHGDRAMVILPYKDRLELLARYLQQLVMESLGKERDLEGMLVNQGIAVYGNKGSTDQHAFVQQLREGRNDFFVTFVEVLEDLTALSDRALYAGVDLRPGIRSGDYLSAFLQGTRAALAENGRPSITLTLDRLTPFGVGALIALFERAVGLYAALIGINPYDQPGVEAGKRAATAVLDVQRRVLDYLKGFRRAQLRQPPTPAALASDLQVQDAASAGFLGGLADLGSSATGDLKAHAKAAGELAEAGARMHDYLLGYRKGLEGRRLTAGALAEDLEVKDEVEMVFLICRHLAANPGRGVAVVEEGGPAGTVFGPAD